MEISLVQRFLAFLHEVEWNSTPNVVMFALTTHMAFHQAHQDRHASTTALLGALSHIGYAGYCLWNQSNIHFALNFFLWRVAVFYATLAVSITVYRLFFHRLRRFPGPFAAKVTKFYNSWHYIGGRNYQNLDKLHKQYGRVVRTAPQELSFTSPDALMTIYGPHTACTRGPFYDSNNVKGEWSVNTTHDKRAHQVRRKLWEKAFTSKSMNDYFPRVVETANALLNDISSAEENPIRTHQLFGKFVISVIGDVGFNADITKLEAGVLDMPQTLLDRLMAVQPIIQVPWLGRMLTSLVPSVALSRTFGQIGRGFIAARNKVAPASLKPDIFQWIGQAESSGLVVSDKVVLTEAVLVMTAGFQTTATTFTNLFYNLVKYPEHLKILQSELDKVFDDVPNGQLPDYKTFSSIPYLDAVVNETLRLLPVATGAFTRVTPPEGILVDGEHIPGNVYVSVPQWSYFKDPKIFPRPEEFLPERWITKSPDLLPKDSLFFPFSMGRDSCVGKPLAVMELRVAVALVLRRFDIHAASTKQVDNYLNSLQEAIILFPGMLDLVFTERSRTKV